MAGCATCQVECLRMGYNSFVPSFSGADKHTDWFLKPFEDWFSAKLLPLVPLWFETNHMTLTTVIWSVLVLLFSYLAQFNLLWLWVVSFVIILQYVTDVLDGRLGKMRNTGLVKWGFFMDHFLDYVFSSSILIGYAIIMPDRMLYLLFILAIGGAFMVNEFLHFGATGRFKVSYFKISPSEVRMAFVGVNILFILFGKTYMGFAMPFVLAGAFVALCITVYQNHQEIWELDMEGKE